MALDLVARAALDGFEQVGQIAVFELHHGMAPGTDDVMAVAFAREGIGVAAIGLVHLAHRAALDQHVIPCGRIMVKGN
jgi:hypothetical protein